MREFIFWIEAPVLLLTARDAVHDRALGLDSGTDDRLGKR